MKAALRAALSPGLPRSARASRKAARRHEVRLSPGMGRAMAQLVWTVVRQLAQSGFEQLFIIGSLDLTRIGEVSEVGHRELDNVGTMR